MFQNSDDPNPSEKTILEKITFIKIEDKECGVIGWKYEEEVPGLISSSNRTFDTLREAIESYLENLPNLEEEN